MEQHQARCRRDLTIWRRATCTGRAASASKNSAAAVRCGCGGRQGERNGAPRRGSFSPVCICILLISLFTFKRFGSRTQGDRPHPSASGDARARPKSPRAEASLRIAPTAPELVPSFPPPPPPGRARPTAWCSRAAWQRCANGSPAVRRA